MTRKRTNAGYPMECKVEAARLYRESGKSLREALGMTPIFGSSRSFQPPLTTLMKLREREECHIDDGADRPRATRRAVSYYLLEPSISVCFAPVRSVVTTILDATTRTPVEDRRRHCNQVRPHSAREYRPPALEAVLWPSPPGHLAHPLPRLMHQHVSWTYQQGQVECFIVPPGVDRTGDGS